MTQILFARPVSARIGLRAVRMLVPALVAVLATSALAQDFKPSHLAAARALIAATHMADQFDKILPTIAEQAKMQFISQNPSDAKAIEEVVGNVAIGLAKRRPEINAAIEQAWAARFTEDELKQLVTFYSSPLGTKLLQYQDGIVKDSLAAARSWQDSIGADIMQQSKVELDKRAK